MIVTWALQGNALPGDPHAEAGMVKLQELVAQFPNSTYAQYARARLLEESKSAPAENPSPPTTRLSSPPPETPKAPPPLAPAAATPAPPPDGGIRPLFLLVGMGLFVALLIWWLRRR